METGVPKSSVTSDLFRTTLGRFATGVVVITTFTEQGPVGITVNSFTSLSLEPPLILFCLDEKAKRLPAFKVNHQVAINILTDEQSAMSRHFAQNFEWGTVPYAFSSCGTPWLPGCLAYLDCELVNQYAAGDHIIFIGRVIDAMVQDDPLARPLLYYYRKYRRLGESIIQ